MPPRRAPTERRNVDGARIDVDGPDFLRHRSPIRVRLDCHDPGGTGENRELDQVETDRPASGHEDGAAGKRAGALDCVHGNAGRLEERGGIE
jgi:hypothetical protein